MSLAQRRLLLGLVTAVANGEDGEDFGPISSRAACVGRHPETFTIVDIQVLQKAP